MATVSRLTEDVQLKAAFYKATVEAQNHINQLLRLPATGSEQEWEIELADPLRVEEMIDTLARSVHLSLDCQCALALLIISSMEVADELDQLKPSCVAKMARMLPTQPIIASRMYFYWVALGRLLNPDLGQRIFSAYVRGTGVDALPANAGEFERLDTAPFFKDSWGFLGGRS